MGNCLFGGLGEEGDVIKVTKPDGGVLEFYAPITAGNITHEFPGHSIFPSNDTFTLSKPFSHDHHLVPGHSYYLLPVDHDDDDDRVSYEEGSCHVRSKSESFPAITPYRMSLDKTALKRSYTDVLSRKYYRAERERVSKKRRSGMWKVKLVIHPQQLLHILSQDGTTHDLIESVRAVANCPNAAVSSSFVAFSDNFSSLSSSRNASSDKDFAVLETSTY